MIRNLDQNKFIDPRKYTGMNGEWIKGVGILFDTKEDAELDFKRNSNPNVFKYAYSERKIQNKTYHVISAYQIWD